MRRKVTPETLHQFMREFAASARGPGKVYLTGGATALLLGFRQQTIDIDLRLDPEPMGAFEAIVILKERLDLNIELASPADFIPAHPAWRERSRRIETYGQVEFYHYDFAMQALAKLERGHRQDLEDVRLLLSKGFVNLSELREVFQAIKPGLVRYPAVDAGQFEQVVYSFLSNYEQRS